MSRVSKITFKIEPKSKDSEKPHVYLKLDSDVLHWFKSKGRGYQSFINEVLKAYKEAEESQPKTEKSDSRFEYAQACFNDFYAQCFWHLRKDLIVTESEISIIIEGLKKYGGKEGFIRAQRLLSSEVL